jgi:hypothetical protein
VRLIVIDNAGAVVILVPAFAGGLLVIWRPGRAVLFASALLTSLTAGVSLIGGVGLLYVPSIVLFVRGAVSRRARTACHERRDSRRRRFCWAWFVPQQR